MITSEFALAMLKAVGDASPSAIMAKDTELRFVYANPAFLDRMGVTEGEVLGRTSEEVFAPGPLRVDDVWRRVLATGEALVTGSMPVELFGQRVDVRMRHFPVKDETGRIIGAAAIVEDMTREALLAEANERAALRYRVISEQTPSIIWSCTEDGTIDFVNERWHEFVGLGRDPQAWSELVHPEDRERIDASITLAILEHRAWREQFRLRHHSGEYRWVLGRAVAFWNGSEGLYYGSFTDIHALITAQQTARALQAEAAHLARVHDLGHMASTLAHELNQPLAAASNYIEAAAISLRRSPDQGQNREVMGLAAAQVVRASEIVRRLRDFLRKRPTTREPAPLGGLVREAVDLALIGSGAKRVKVEYALPPASVVAVDTVQIQQVIVNLVRNAVEATEGIAEPLIEIGGAPSEPGFVELAVADNGSGLTEAAAAALFEPFVTTKVGGLGVGLSLSRTIVEAHGGRIWADPPDGRGATFRLLLPSVAGGRADAAA